MVRLCVLFCALCCLAGCTAADRAQWDEVLKDARGDNMRMRGDFSGTRNRDTSSGRIIAED